MTNILFNKKHIDSISPYIGIFFVLFMGSGLVKIPVGSALFYVIKFGIIGAVLGIGVSAWRRAKLRNEPPTAYLKLALFVAFTIDFHLHFAFIFLTIILFNKKLLLPWNSPLKPIYLLFIWGFISYVINQFVEFNPLSFPLYVVIFFTPWIFFGIAYKNVNTENINQILQHFYNVLMIMIVIIAIQTVVFWNEHPDLRNGGIKDAHFAALYLSIGFFIVINRYQTKQNFGGLYKLHELLLLFLTIPLLYLIDAKYILIFVLTIMIVSFFMFRNIRWKYKVLILLGLISGIFYYLLFTSRALPVSVTALKHSSFTIDGIVKHFPETPKGQLFKEAINMPSNYPSVFFIGSGPGTFLSVAANSRTPKDSLKYMMTYTREYVRVESKLPAFIKPFISWIKYKYGKSYFSFNDFGSSIYDWSSGLLNIYFEMGIIGLFILLYFFFNLLALNRKSKSKYQMVLFSVLILLFLINIINPWLEQQNFVIIQSILLASVINN